MNNKGSSKGGLVTLLVFAILFVWFFSGIFGGFGMYGYFIRVPNLVSS